MNPDFLNNGNAIRDLVDATAVYAFWLFIVVSYLVYSSHKNSDDDTSHKSSDDDKKNSDV